MHNHFVHIFVHVLKHGLSMLPFLFGAYLFMEYVEHHASEKMNRMLAKRSGGVVVGTLLGCVPQCGFSVAAANLYSGGVITAGTLLAVFLSTSDEALVVLLAHPDHWPDIAALLVTKIILAIAVGLLVDFFIRRAHHENQHHIHDLCEEHHCGCETEPGILRPALRHTAKVFVYVLIVLLVLEVIMHGIGEERLSQILLIDSPLQPVVTSLFGLIPNCAVSVALTELYISGSLSFGSAIAGLSTSAGMGLMVLLRTNHNWKENLKIIAILLAAGCAVGILLQLVM